MTGRHAIWVLLAAALVALAIVIAFGSLGRQEVVRGYLCAFVLVAMIPIGSLALLLVHGLTGGSWGEDLAPVLVPAARAMPLLVVAALPVVVFRAAIYDWGALHLEPDVMLLYLNPLFFDARTLVALALWSLLAWTAAWRRPLLAGFGLVVHLILSSLVPPDWVLTILPGTTSAAFGVGFGIEQIFAALAFAAVLAPQGGERRANADLSGLLISAVLGTSYFAFMQFLIPWYGNVPEKVKWFALRSHNGWAATVAVAFALGGALPFLAMLNTSVRQSPAALRLVGAVALCGVVLHVAWLTMPGLGATVMPPALPAAVALAALMITVVQLAALGSRGDAHVL